MTASVRNTEGRLFELWMIANFSVGAGQAAFAVLLIPRYITEVTGSGAEAGVAMAILSLAAVLGPVLGGLADKYLLHRLVMNLGILFMALGFVGFAISAPDNYIAINWMAVVAAGLSVALLIVGIWPAERKKHEEEAALLTA